MVATMGIEYKMVTFFLYPAGNDMFKLTIETVEQGVVQWRRSGVFTVNLTLNIFCTFFKCFCG